MMRNKRQQTIRSLLEVIWYTVTTPRLTCFMSPYRLLPTGRNLFAIEPAALKTLLTSFVAKLQE